MSHKDTAFYRGNKQINFDFTAEEISSDGAVLLLEKLERKHKLINYFSNVIPDLRDSIWSSSLQRYFIRKNLPLKK